MKLKLDEDTAVILYRIIGALDLSDEGVERMNEDLNSQEIHALFGQLEDKLKARGFTHIGEWNHYADMEK